MIKSGEILKIEIIDHFIITKEAYNSFADKDLIKELK